VKLGEEIHPENVASIVFLCQQDICKEVVPVEEPPMPKHIQNVKDRGTIPKRFTRPRSLRLHGDAGCRRRPKSKRRRDCHLGLLGRRRDREGRTLSGTQAKGSLLQGSRGHGGRKPRRMMGPVRTVTQHGNKKLNNM